MKRLLAMLALLAGVAGAPGYELPPVNLGFTSFLDGAPPAGPGFYFAEYLQYYRSERLNNKHGDELLLPTPGGLKGARLDVYVSLNQLIYQSDKKVLPGGKWGLDVILPLVMFDLEPDKLLVLKDNGAGIGDLLIGPYLQWDPVMGEKGPLFLHRIELQCILPTGRYQDKYELNPGSNFFSFNPYWAWTLFLQPRWSLSSRIHYLWNDTNEDPSKRLYPGASHIQAGQAAHLNFATEYELIEKRLRLGLNGYYLKQFTDTKVNGDNVSGTQEEVVALGPGAVLHMSQNDHIFFNAYFELDSENRPQGQRLILRWVHHF